MCGEGEILYHTAVLADKGPQNPLCTVSEGLWFFLPLDQGSSFDASLYFLTPLTVMPFAWEWGSISLNW